MCRNIETKMIRRSSPIPCIRAYRNIKTCQIIRIGKINRRNFTTIQFRNVCDFQDLKKQGFDKSQQQKQGEKKRKSSSQTHTTSFPEYYLSHCITIPSKHNKQKH